ncbi:glycosyltransferase family 4 protein [Cellvibrio sp.]|uniref:glycosyltransferase family 4 protein n=1 Tax=Cellvibrio sp. TaxID=1965322 RepID=UPI00396477A3
MKKTVWFVTKYFEPPTEGTPGGRSFLLMDALSKKGVDTVIITSNSCNLYTFPELTNKVTKQSVNELNIVWLKTLSYKTAKSLRRVLSWFHFEWNLFFLDKTSLPRPDVVIISSLSLLTILNGLLIKRKFNCKLVFEIRDIWPLTLVEEGGVGRWNPFILFLSFVEKVGYKHADVIVGTMPNLKEHVKEVIGYERQVHCVPMGLASDYFDLKSFEKLGSEIEELIPADKFIVMYAGTIGITNALETFFESAKILQCVEKIHFLVVGDGSLRSSFMDKYAGLKNLTFAPKVKKNQVQSILAKADVLYLSTFPSKIWKYGQSLNKVIDYMLSGKPVIASYDGFPSMLNEANCGFFLPAGDVRALVEKIEAVYKMPVDEQKKLGHNGRDWLITNRSYPKLAADYLDILFEHDEAFI